MIVATCCQILSNVILYRWICERKKKKKFKFNETKIDKRFCATLKLNLCRARFIVVGFMKEKQSFCFPLEINFLLHNKRKSREDLKVSSAPGWMNRKLCNKILTISTNRKSSNDTIKQMK